MTDFEIIRAAQASLTTSHKRIEAKVDAVLGMVTVLVRALAEDDQEPAAKTLDGSPAGQERDAGQSLG